MLEIYNSQELLQVHTVLSVLGKYFLVLFYKEKLELQLTDV